MKYLIAVLLPFSCIANVDVNPNGKTYTVDAYGDDRRPTREEMDLGGNRRLQTPIHRSLQIPLNGVRFSNIMFVE